jgi:tRNA pseudouridine(38-40) synthase
MYTLKMLLSATPDGNWSKQPSSTKEITLNEFKWAKVAEFWTTLISKDSDPPAWVKGDADFGLSDIAKLEAVGELSGEFSKGANDLRYSMRKTFALVIGYRGVDYDRGFQRQRVPYGQVEERTVELDMRNAIDLGTQIVVAGRTDKYVSAVSQVVNIIASGEMTSDEILRRVRESEPVKAGRLVCYGVARAPRSFSARGSATWRRYLYLVPLEGSLVEGLDTGFVNEVLNNIEGKELPYDAFAFGECRKQGAGLLDLCTLYRARAFEVTVPTADGSSRALCVELVGNRFLRRMVRLLVATAVREALKPDGERDAAVIDKICHEGDRARTAYPFPGAGLAFAGCGFNYKQLAYFKFMSKVNKARLDTYFEEGGELGKM